jgi:hypothetical protein
MSILEGICQQCGACYYGLSFSQPNEQTCGDCGHVLEIFAKGVRIEKNYSPRPTEAASGQTKSKSNGRKHLRGGTK